jgi:uncharacterized protein with GYD domain
MREGRSVLTRPVKWSFDGALPEPFHYTTKKALLTQPQDRSAAARDTAESLGGELLSFWYAFGECDGVFPDGGARQRVGGGGGMAVGASGALSDIETTVLLDMDEAQDAMRGVCPA